MVLAKESLGEAGAGVIVTSLSDRCDGTLMSIRWGCRVVR